MMEARWTLLPSQGQRTFPHCRATQRRGLPLVHGERTTIKVQAESDLIEEGGIYICTTKRIARTTFISELRWYCD